MKIQQELNMEVLKMTKIQDASLYEILPFNIKSDNIEVQALSYAVQQSLSMLCKFSDGVRIMAAIDNMPEKVINNLAVELNLPCFHPESNIDVKRTLVKDAFIWHTIAGTASAIRRYFSTISQDTDIQEWFDYGGDPYHFRIIVTVPENQEVTEDILIDMAQQIVKLKNARSILDEALIVKEHNQDMQQAMAIGVAVIQENNLGESEESSNWLDDDTFIMYSSSEESTVFCDKNGNVFTV